VAGLAEATKDFLKGQNLNQWPYLASLSLGNKRAIQVMQEGGICERDIMRLISDSKWLEAKASGREEAYDK